MSRMLNMSGLSNPVVQEVLPVICSLSLIVMSTRCAWSYKPDAAADIVSVLQLVLTVLSRVLICSTFPPDVSILLRIVYRRALSMHSHHSPPTSHPHVSVGSVSILQFAADCFGQNAEYAQFRPLMLQLVMLTVCSLLLIVLSRMLSMLNFAPWCCSW